MGEGLFKDGKVGRREDTGLVSFPYLDIHLESQTPIGDLVSLTPEPTKSQHTRERNGRQAGLTRERDSNL